MRFMSQEEAIKQDKMLLDLGLDIRSLIEVAGHAAFETLIYILRSRGIRGPIAVLSGPGNNGADGLVIARYLKYAGYDVTVFYLKTRYQSLIDICKSVGIRVVNSLDFEGFDNVLDALFGFSFKGPVSEPYRACIQKFRKIKNVISVDVPSGHEVDKETNDEFKPTAVICYMAPKICCSRLRFYVTRAFSPQMGFEQDYGGFMSSEMMVRQGYD